MFKYVLPFIVMILGMIGGQINKEVRRYGIPFTEFFISIFNKKAGLKESFKKSILFLTLIALFSIGYGEHSWLKKQLKYEWLCRFVYASFFSLFFIPFGMWYAWPILVAVRQVRSGGFKIGKYDFLYEDAAWYLVLGFFGSVLIYK